jgi:hypothetical protein
MLIIRFEKKPCCSGSGPAWYKPLLVSGRSNAGIAGVVSLEVWFSGRFF